MNGTSGANASSGNNTRLMNSLIAPLNMVNNAAQNAVKNVSTNLGNLGSNISNNIGNLGSNISNNLGFKTNMANNSSSSNTGLIIGAIVVLAVIGAIVGVLYYFQNEVSKAFSDAKEVLSGYFGPQAPPPEQKADESKKDKTAQPDATLAGVAASVEKVLPGGAQVFNVSSNKFTYYDAAPLCKALGAELATYDQVKDSWAKGADWCNYGWVKGQMAVYPTSDETYSKLQSGPEEQRMSCGRPGVNGGYFDNPEMRFGVNCYGTKPPQGKHDAVDQAKGAPISPDALAFDKKVNQYKTDADNIGLSPFNSHSW